MLCAVFFDGYTFEYTRLTAPDEIMEDLIQCNDGMIGLFELLAVLLVVETWSEKLKSSKWHAYEDNDGVLHSVTNATRRAVDVNQILRLFWRRLHTTATDLTAFRVKSNTNSGYAGSRIEEVEDLHDVKRLNAAFVTPRLPDFAYSIWSPPTNLASHL